MSEHSVEQAAEGIARHDGLVGLALTGPRPLPMTAGEIVEAARGATFVDECALTDEYEGGRAVYTPREMGEDAVTETIMEGRVVNRISVYENAPPGRPWLQPGTYFVWVDFVEGPDFNEGRFVGRTVSEDGRVVHVNPRVEMKTVISFHLDEQEREHHARPEMMVHGLGRDEVSERLFRDFEDGDGETWRNGDNNGEAVTLSAGAAGWIVTSGSWRSRPHGCAKTYYCNPG
jgi:hypothetical protein